MTSPSPQTLEREKERLYVSDAELIRRMGVPEKRTAILRKRREALISLGSGLYLWARQCGLEK